MAKLPFLKFFPRDWLQDTRCLTPLAKSVWIDLLCAMWDSPNRGQISWPIELYSRYLSLNETDTQKAIQELIDSGTAETTETVSVTLRDVKVTLMSRRMLREEKERSQNLTRQRRFRNAKITQTSRGIFQKSEYKNPKIRKEQLEKTDQKNDQLSEQISAPAARIFESDKIKFKRLFSWIGQARKTYDDQTIAETLQRFERSQVQPDNWFPYLTAIIKKAYGDLNAANSEQESNYFKSELSETVRQLSNAKKIR